MTDSLTWCGTELAQRLGDQSADSSGGGHVSRSRAAENNLLPADANSPRRTVGEEDDLHRNLFRKPRRLAAYAPDG